jgi:hypothetical protein
MADCENCKYAKWIVEKCGSGVYVEGDYCKKSNPAWARGGDCEEYEEYEDPEYEY